MLQNKLKRIKLKQVLSNLPQYKIVSINVGDFVRLSYFNTGWSNQVFYGVCVKSYHTADLHNKIVVYNSKQFLKMKINLNLNIFKSIYKFTL